MPDRADTPLRGFTIGSTAARRADEFATLLERRGAEVIGAPAIRIIPLADDADLRRATESLIATPPDVVVATTAIGFRGWIGAAEGWGLAEPLTQMLGTTRLLARGPKVKGAIRAAELREEWSPVSESSAGVLEHLLAEGVVGQHIAVQLHGADESWGPMAHFCTAMTDAGATVIPVQVYRWTDPDDLAPVDRLVHTVVDRGVDALAFTSAPAVVAILGRAQALGVTEPFLDALAGDVLVACVGPVTAAPLQEVGIPVVMPERYRLGALAKLLADVLPARERPIDAAGHELRVRARSVLVDGEARPLAPTVMALLRILAQRPGVVVSREDLLGELPGGSADTHAVETAVARLRSGLGVPEAIRTVVKRGYRLDTEPQASPASGAQHAQEALR